MPSEKPALTGLTLMVDASALNFEEGGKSCSVADQVEALRVLRQCLADGTPVPSEVSSKVEAGIGEYLWAIDRGQSASLDFTLGLKNHGGVPASKAVVIRERDRLLRYLASSQPRWQGKSISLVSHEICAEFSRYEAGRWYKDRQRTVPPRDEPQATFWMLKRNRCKVPGKEAVRKILSLVIQDPI